MYTDRCRQSLLSFNHSGHKGRSGQDMEPIHQQERNMPCRAERGAGAMQYDSIALSILLFCRVLLFLSILQARSLTRTDGRDHCVMQQQEQQRHHQKSDTQQVTRRRTKQKRKEKEAHQATGSLHNAKQSELNKNAHRARTETEKERLENSTV